MATAIRLGASLRHLVADPHSTFSATKNLFLKASKPNLVHTHTKSYKSYPVITSHHPRTTLTPPHVRSPATTIRRTYYSDPCGCKVIKKALEETRHEKWGWVIYRTSYNNNDLAWSRFKDLLSQQTAHYVSKSDTPEIINNVEWTFMDDRATFNRMSRYSLRQHFKQWAETAVVAENPRAEGEGHKRSSSVRYCMFIQIDAECLEDLDCNDYLSEDFDWQLPQSLKLIDADWKPRTSDPKELARAIVEYREWLKQNEPDAYDPEIEVIDGYSEDNVGWMMIPSGHMSPAFYISILGRWDRFYVRPPKVLRW